MEFIVGRKESIIVFLKMIAPYLLLKKRQAKLMLKILNQKDKVENEKDFAKLAQLIEKFRVINYSKTRKRLKLTP